jgi:colanic acid biosynthesis glycosyl transferase WcaI
LNRLAGAASGIVLPAFADERPRLLVINLYYAPDVASTGQYAAEICRTLAGRGFEVHVVAGQPSYTSGQPDAPPFEMMDGVAVHRVSLGRSRGRERMAVRVAGYLRFLWGAWGESRRLVRTVRPEGVLTFHNPPFVGLIGAWLARRHALRFTYALYDIHPDVLLATRWGRIPGPLLWMWDRLNAWIFRHAEKVVVPGEGMRRTVIRRKGVKPQQVAVIPFWARPELQPAERDGEIRRELGVCDDELLFLYSGNMGIMHPLDPILDAAADSADLPVRFLFVGDGARRRSLVERVKRQGLVRVSFLPFQDEDRYVRLLAAADASFVALAPGLEGLAVPSRAYTILSAGRPLITIMAPEADIARMVSGGECGWNVTSGTELAALLRRLVADPAELARRGSLGRQLYLQRFQRRIVIEEYVRLLCPNPHPAVV